MADKTREQELLETVKKYLGDPIRTIGYLEHQLDLMGKLVQDLSGIVDQTKVTTDIQSRLDLLNELMAHSSVDFDNLSDPLQSYKIPKAVETKGNTRTISTKYLQKKMDEGLL